MFGVSPTGFFAARAGSARLPKKKWRRERFMCVKLQYKRVRHAERSVLGDPRDYPIPRCTKNQSGTPVPGAHEASLELSIGVDRRCSENSANRLIRVHSCAFVANPSSQR